MATQGVHNQGTDVCLDSATVAGGRKKKENQKSSGRRLTERLQAERAPTQEGCNKKNLGYARNSTRSTPKITTLN